MENWLVVEGHTGQAVDSARVWSPEGRWEAMGSLDGTFRLWVPEVEVGGLWRSAMRADYGLRW